MANLVDKYLNRTVYIDDLKVGDIITTLDIMPGTSSIWSRDLSIRYKIVSLNYNGAFCAETCPNYGCCIKTVPIDIKPDIQHQEYGGIACYYKIGSIDKIRYSKRK